MIYSVFQGDTLISKTNFKAEQIGVLTQDEIKKIKDQVYDSKVVQEKIQHGIIGGSPTTVKLDAY